MLLFRWWYKQYIRKIASVPVFGSNVYTWKFQNRTGPNGFDVRGSIDIENNINGGGGAQDF